MVSSVVEGYLKQARDNKFEEIYESSEFHANPVTQGGDAINKILA